MLVEGDAGIGKTSRRAEAGRLMTELGGAALAARGAVDAADRLLDPSPPTALVGAWSMLLALIIASGAGTIATIRGWLIAPLPYVTVRRAWSVAVWPPVRAVSTSV